MINNKMKDTGVKGDRRREFIGEVVADLNCLKTAPLGPERSDSRSIVLQLFIPFFFVSCVVVCVCVVLMRVVVVVVDAR